MLTSKAVSGPIFAASLQCETKAYLLQQGVLGLTSGGLEICIDGLSFWLMRIAREIGRGTSMQALRERRACQERADAHQAALPVQSLRPELHRHAPTRQTAGPEGSGRAALCQRPLDEPHRQAH